jgi:hypothetical protein
VGNSEVDSVPESADALMALRDVVVTLVTRPYSSTVIIGMLFDAPYEPLLTPDVGNTEADNVPVLNELAFKAAVLT